MFSESAQLSIREVRDWADEEAAEADQWEKTIRFGVTDPALAARLRPILAKHQARARWLYEVLANATVDREKTD